MALVLTQLPQGEPFGLQADGIALAPEESEDTSVDGIGLGPSAVGTHKVLHVKRVDLADGHPVLEADLDQEIFVSAGGFADDAKAGLLLEKLAKQGADGTTGVVDALLELAGMDLEVFLGDVDAHLAVVAESLGTFILTSDPDDMSKLEARHERY